MWWIGRLACSNGSELCEKRRNRVEVAAFRQNRHILQSFRLDWIIRVVNPEVAITRFMGHGLRIGRSVNRILKRADELLVAVMR